MPRYDFKLPRDAPPERVDAYLARQAGMPSRSRLKDLFDQGGITLNDKAVRPSAKVRAGDRIIAIVPDPVPIALAPEPIPLVIIHQDHDLVVFDKPAGLLTHPTASIRSDTLVNALLHHCRDLSGIGGALKPGIVHRLDRLTSGVMVAAKNDRAHQALAIQFAAHSIERRYLAIVYGEMEALTGVFASTIGRNPHQRLMMTGTAKKGRRAVTRYRVRSRSHGFSLLELELETGRTHQIRVHLSENNHPLLGDPLYHRGRSLPAFLEPWRRDVLRKLKRQALHAYHLGFLHPADGALMAFESPPPADFIEAAQAAGLLEGVALPSAPGRVK